jgi:hypothetical protein
MQLAVGKTLAPAVAKNSNLFVELCQAEKQIIVALKPAKLSEILAILSKLRLHYPLANIESRQVEILLSDYVEDLSFSPLDLLLEACREYRRNPANQFFPKIGELLQPTKEKWCARKWQLIQIKIMIAKAEYTQELDYEENRQLIRQVQADVDSFLKNLLGQRSW